MHWLWVSQIIFGQHFQLWEKKQNLPNWLNQALNKEESKIIIEPPSLITSQITWKPFYLGDRAYDERRLMKAYLNYKNQFYLGEGGLMNPPNGVELL